jgi:hypothetical protein
MPEFRYARGRIVDSIRYLSEEMKEFQEDYADQSWQDYQKDKKLQKLIDRTVENILTALIEVCGAFLTNQEIAAESYLWRRPEKGGRASGPDGAGTKRPRRIGPAEKSPGPSLSQFSLADDPRIF